MEELQLLGMAYENVTVEPKPWMKDCRFVLVTEEELPKLVDRCIAAGKFAIDLETTGLNINVVNGETVDKIVGVCLTYDENVGYYIPVRHKEGRQHNIRWTVFHREMKRLLDSDAISIFHNAMFDQEFLEFNGTGPLGNWDDVKRWEDTLILAYLWNNKAKQRGLKYLSNTELGMEMIEIHDLFGPDKNGKKRKDLDFSTLDPSWEPCLWYTGSDAICTLRLFNVIEPRVKKPENGKDAQKGIYWIERRCANATRWMERARIRVDRDKVKALIQSGQRDWLTAIAAVYEAASKALGRDVTPGWFKLFQGNPIGEHLKFDPDVIEPAFTDRVKVARRFAKSQMMDSGHPDVEKMVPKLSGGGVEQVQFPHVYDILSSQQLGNLLREMQVPGLTATDSGKVATGNDVIEKILETSGDDFEFLDRIALYRSITKALGTYLVPLWEDSLPEIDRDGKEIWTVRAGFNGFKTDTGRFAASTSNKPWLDGGTRFTFHGAPAGYDKSGPECLWRIRECIIPRADKVLAGIDYAGVELRIVTVLSREPKWENEYFRCSQCNTEFERPTKGVTPWWIPPFCPTCGSDKIGDIHTLTTLSIYGNDVLNKPDFKAYRQNSKCVHTDTIIATSASGRGPNPTRIGSLPLGEVDEFKDVAPELEVAVSKNAYAGMQTYNGGVKPLYHVVSRRGILTCSDQHRIQLADGSLASIESGLEKGVELFQPETPLFCHEEGSFPVLTYRPHTQVPQVQIKTDAKLAYFAGLFLGDGAKSGTNSVGIVHGHVSKTDQNGTSYTDWQKAIESACLDAGFSPTLRKKSVYLGSRHVMRFLHALGLVEGVEGGRVLRVPDWILSSGPHGIQAFLGGLFDTDGFVSLHDGAARWTTKDAVFAGQVAALFHGMGVVPTVEACWNKTYERYYYRVGLSGSQATWLKPHMRHPGKIERMREGVNPHPRIGNPVLAIIPAGEHQCVDLNVFTEDHLYWANGMTVHNSVNFALCYGGSGRAVQAAAGVDKNEGARIKSKFDATYNQLQYWWKETRAKAKVDGYVLTAFGRRCALPDIKLPEHEQRKNPDGTVTHINNGAFIAKAERNATNAPIQGCLHPHARVMTSAGYLPIEDLWQLQQTGDETDLKIWTGRSWESGRVLTSGIKPQRVTVFEEGTEVPTSPEHLFRVWRDGNFEWVPQDDLDRDWVAFNSEALDLPEPSYQYSHTVNPQEGHLFSQGMTPHNYKGFHFDGNSETLWEFLGFIYGDGSIRSDGFTLHCGGKDAKAFASFYADKINSSLNVGAITYEKKRGEGDGRLPMWQVKIHNTAFRDFTRTLGVEDQNTYTKRVPKALWSESIKHRAAFIRGYFSADGTITEALDHINVRSANEGLLRDTHALLQSIGIRSALRLKSQRVTVLDRFRFRDLVGFTNPAKESRIANMAEFPYSHQNHRLPPSLVKEVGMVIRESEGWAQLSKDEKSAVYRLMAGSGSKTQCLKYLTKLSLWDDLSPRQTKALSYDWQRVKRKVVEMDDVFMYDIEVFDNDHAFVCDNAIVHNTSADITKAAMGFIYAECRKRGWLDKIHMLMTIHDELVFEIDFDILEEALEMIEHQMSRNNLVQAVKWPIPLLVDIELGMDWTVKWALNDFKLGKKPWPELLAPHFKKKHLDYPAPPSKGGPEVRLPLSFVKKLETPTIQTKPVSEDVPKPAESSTESSAESPKSDPEKVLAPAPIRITAERDPNGEFVHVIRNMDLDTVMVLGIVLGQSADSGTARLRFKDPYGRDHTDTFEKLWGGPVHVNPATFETLWQYVWRNR